MRSLVRSCAACIPSAAHRAAALRCATHPPLLAHTADPRAPPRPRPPPAAQQAGPQHLQTCYGNLLTSGFFSKGGDKLDGVNNAFLMALLASDAYPATLLGE